MIFVGDFCPLNKQVGLDLRDGMILANLEAPVLHANHGFKATSKAGPSLFSCTLPEREKPMIFALANNHIMDYGEAGLKTTQLKLSSKKYHGIGAGTDISSARQPLVIREGNKKIGIISCCEAQFGIAQEHKPGVAEMGVWIYGTISKLREEVDFLVVSIHRGIEESPWPSPRIRETYHSFIDAGATIIHGHHSHVPQGIEEYEDGIILYGLGNFLVDPDKWKDFPNALWSVGIEINFDVFPLKWKTLTFEIYSTNPEKVCTRESTCEERKSHMEYLNNCNFPLANAHLLNSLWQEVSLRTYFHHKASYLDFLDNKKNHKSTIKKNVKKAIFKVLNIKVDLKESKSKTLLRYVMFACDSHREAIATALGILSGEILDKRCNESNKLADEMMPWSVNIVENENFF